MAKPKTSSELRKALAPFRAQPGDVWVRALLLEECIHAQRKHIRLIQHIIDPEILEGLRLTLQKLLTMRRNMDGRY